MTSERSSSGLEIERQFLLGAVPESVRTRAERVHRIRQAYLTTVPPAIRVRCLDDRSLLTVKSGGTMVREEVEIDIDEEAARRLFRMAPDRVIEKTRYVLGGWEVDVFHGRHTGVFVAEFEMETPDTPLPPFPDGLEPVRELTHDPTFSNQILAQLDARGVQVLLTRLLR